MEFEKVFVKSLINKTFKIVGTVLKPPNKVGSHVTILIEKPFKFGNKIISLSRLTTMLSFCLNTPLIS